MKRGRKKYLIYLSICLVLISLFTPKFLTLIGFPEDVQIIKGHQQLLDIDFPFPVYIRTKESQHLTINGQSVGENYFKVDLGKPLAIKSLAVGKVDLEFNLFGLIPIREATVKVIPQVKVYPSGESIGVVLKSQGVIVVKKSYVVGSNDQKYYPAREAGIEVGDRILAVNGEKVTNKESLAQSISYYAQRQEEITIKLNRDGNLLFKKLKPKKNYAGRYMVGIYIDDGATGVGTMTFYDPRSKRFGALGHMITTPSSRTKLPVRTGKIVQADISGIQRGSSGLPGEKLGTFLDEQQLLGRITKNDRFGVYGKVVNSEANRHFSEPIPVATALQVKRGPAKIYTVVAGNQVKEFDIQILKVVKQYQPHEKGLVIKITDDDLLEQTGGIVQGMSGSPIVQEGKLVGAVTHVFMNDSTKGYGVLAEWMIEKAGIIRHKMANNLGG
ncbi:MAG: SpoIVB peptidase [Bacillota bacterium]